MPTSLTALISKDSTGLEASRVETVVENDLIDLFGKETYLTKTTKHKWYTFQLKIFR